MNEIVDIFLLAGDKFMPEMYLKQPGFTYRACRPFTKETKYIYNNELCKACFQHLYGDFKDLGRKTASDKVFRDKAINIAKNLKYAG